MRIVGAPPGRTLTVTCFVAVAKGSRTVTEAV